MSLKSPYTFTIDNVPVFWMLKDPYAYTLTGEGTLQIKAVDIGVNGKILGAFDGIPLNTFDFKCKETDITPEGWESEGFNGDSNFITYFPLGRNNASAAGQYKIKNIPSSAYWMWNNNYISKSPKGTPRTLYCYSNLIPNSNPTDACGRGIYINSHLSGSDCKCNSGYKSTTGNAVYVWNDVMNANMCTP